MINVINRLEAIENRYNEISNELSNPEVVSDIKKMTAFSKQKDLVDFSARSLNIISDLYLLFNFLYSLLANASLSSISL